MWNIGFPSDYVVVGYDGEYADMDNPEGAVYAERFRIVAEDAKGYRRTWGGLYESPEAAEAAYVLLAPPVDLWDEIQPCYGSEAYADDWEEHEAELDMLDRESEGFFIVTGFRGF
jgi:hypothetical protein